LCIFGSSSWDFVHFRKFLMGFCTFLEVPHRIIHISEFLMGLCTFWKFLKLPKMYKIPRETF
jgi:hypothetical protein